MNDYSKWRQKTALVTSLSLDPKNPRIPYAGEDATPRQIVEQLLVHEKVYELAKSIAELGFFPNEMLVAVEEGGHTTILEGNRRLAALKLLLSPESAPENYSGKFRLLQSQVSADTIKWLRITIAPSREAAAPLIISRHTQPGVERWQPNQQAKYYRTLMRNNADVDLDQFAKQFGIDKSALKKELRTDTMYQIACKLDLPKELHATVSNINKFSYSTLERLFETRKVPEFLGVKFDERGEIIGQIDANEFLRGFSRIVSDIAKGNVDTRTLNSGEDIEIYVSKFGKDKPDTSKKGTFTSDSLFAPTRKESMRSGPSGPAKINTPSKSSPSIVPYGVKCEVENTRVREVFKELKQLKIASHPCATAVMFRIFVELLVANYLTKSGKLDEMLKGGKFKDRKENWLPTLTQMLRAILNDPSIKLDRHAKRNLEKVVNDDTHRLSIDGFDQFVHNLYAEPTERELRAMWNMMSPLIGLLSHDPQPTSTGVGA